MRAAASPQSLAGWYVISLRPLGQHAALASRRGARMAPGCSRCRRCASTPRDDAATRAALRAALAAPTWSCSPARTRCARRRRCGRCARAAGRRGCAVGAGTAAALRRAGIARCRSRPRAWTARACSRCRRCRTCAGARSAWSPRPADATASRRHCARAARDVLRADVYARIAIAPSPRALARAARAGRAAAAGPEQRRGACARCSRPCRTTSARSCGGHGSLAASERLAGLARAHGFDDIVVAASARPRDLLAAALAAARA